MRQFFKHNRALCAFGLRNTPFGMTMVDMSGKAAFLTRQLSQATMAAERAEPLQFVPESSVSVAHVSDRRAGMGFPIAIGCDVGHTQVDAKYVTTILEVTFLNLARYQQIPVAAMEQQ